MEFRRVLFRSESRVAEVRIGPGIGELARQRQAFAAEAEVMAQLQRLLLLEIGGAEDRDRGAVAKPGEAIELTAQQPAPATEILRSEILDVEIDLAGGPDDRHLADHFSRPDRKSVV